MLFTVVGIIGICTGTFLSFQAHPDTLEQIHADLTSMEGLGWFALACLIELTDRKEEKEQKEEE